MKEYSKSFLESEILSMKDFIANEEKNLERLASDIKEDKSILAELEAELEAWGDGRG